MRVLLDTAGAVLLGTGAFSFNQVLRTIGSSFGTAGAAALFAVTADPAGQTTDAGITGAFALGALVCLAVCGAQLARAAARRFRGRRPE